jgi:hypothetical protein
MDRKVGDLDRSKWVRPTSDAIGRVKVRIVIEEAVLMEGT